LDLKVSPTTVAVILLVESRSYLRAIVVILEHIVPLGLQQIAFSGYDGYITDVELRGLPEISYPSKTHQAVLLPR
jgi:hypothetical protein